MDLVNDGMLSIPTGYIIFILKGDLYMFFVDGRCWITYTQTIHIIIKPKARETLGGWATQALGDEATFLSVALFYFLEHASAKGCKRKSLKHH